MKRSALPLVWACTAPQTLGSGYEMVNDDTNATEGRQYRGFQNAFNELSRGRRPAEQGSATDLTTYSITVA